MRALKTSPEARVPTGRGRELPLRYAVAGLGLLLLGLYQTTLCPTIYSGDAAELATAGATFGIPHPPGYPLYSLVANIWNRLVPVGDPAFRQNVLSALSATGAATLLMVLLVRLGAPTGAAALAALGLGLGRTFWSQALVSEVYDFDLLLATGALLLAARAAGRPSLRRGALLCAGLGLWLGHRNVNLLLAPSVILLGWPGLAAGLRTFRGCLVLLGSLLAPCVVYLYLPIASSYDPILDTGDPETWPRFRALVTASAYRSLLRGGVDLGHLTTLLEGLPRDLGIALFLAPLGVWAGWQTRRRETLALAALALANLLFNAFYRVPDVSVFTLPAILALSALGGLGTGRLLRWRPSVWTVALLAGATALLGVANFQKNDLRGQTLARDFARDVLSFPPPGAIVLSQVDTVSFSLDFVQAVEGRRPDVLLVSAGRAADWYQEAIRRRRPDLEIPLYDGPDPTSRWPTILVEKNVARVPVFLTANIQGSFSPSDQERLRRAVEEVPAGLLMGLVPAGRAPRPSTVVRLNDAFWREAWAHARAARAQSLETEMAALLLHYASMRFLYAHYCLWHGEAAAAEAAARAVEDLDTGPVITEVNERYARRRRRYHLSDLPEQASNLRQLASSLASGKRTLKEVRALLGTGVGGRSPANKILPLDSIPPR